MVWLRARWKVLSLAVLALLLLVLFGALSIESVQLRLYGMPASAPEQIGKAVVVAMGDYGEGDDMRPVIITFSIRGQVVTKNVTNLKRWALTRVGDTVTVKYRVNKNGDIYINSWQPPARKKPIPPG